MDLWGALLSAMRTWRAHQISRRAVDRLIAGGSPGLDGHRGLGALLDAAKAPATSGELAGEQAAVEGFAAARRATQPARMRGNNRAGVPLSVRTVAMKVAAAVAVLTVSGTALAARTGHLPAPAQRQAHAIFASLGVPAPTPEPLTTPEPTSAPHPSTTRPQPSSTPSPTAPTTATAVPPMTDLCRQWQDNTLTGTDRKTLRQAAGGEKKIDSYCAPLLTAAASPSPAPSGAPAESPKPGRGPGNSKPVTATPGNGSTQRP
jgi:hypothetical protein